MKDDMCFNGLTLKRILKTMWNVEQQIISYDTANAIGIKL